MSDEDLKKEIWFAAQRLLAASPKSRNELAFKLKQKGYAEGLIETTLQQLEKRALLDDRRFAEELFDRLRNGRRAGKHKIVFEFKRRQIPKEISRDLLEKLDEENEVLAAKEIGFEKWNRFQKLGPLARKKKVYEFLLRQGFDFEIAKSVSDDLNQEDSGKKSEDESL